MSFAVALIDNLSAFTFQAHMGNLDAHWRLGSPSEVYAKARQGQCDAALVPVVRLSDIANVYEPAGPWGIACHGPAYSVRFLAERPLPALVASGDAVFLTGDSQTSRELFEVLCRSSCNAMPRLTENPDQARGVLLIGDAALAPPLPARGWPVRIDLGESWRALTGLSFVFAQWVVRRDLPLGDRVVLFDWLENAVRFGETNEGRGELAHSLVERGYTGEFADRYVRAIRARLGPDELRGMKTFLAMREGVSQWAANA